MKTPAKINPFADIAFALIFVSGLLNAIRGESLWRHVASLCTSRPGVAELLQGTSGLMLLGILSWRGIRLGRSAAKVP